MLEICLICKYVANFHQWVPMTTELEFLCFMISSNQFLEYKIHKNRKTELMASPIAMTWQKKSLVQVSTYDVLILKMPPGK